ncbi:hypothetical protein VM57_10350 [Stenotrophomonas maltophilia]|uniref:Aldehyde oxidase/xanthine dehydrogenase a/b hammerhead domain-containing protein n=1 Tax=Stenotrophomonas maltophilia TaxID=40324 RepID=A0A0F5ZNK1_STEMA|nr:hypothetical protein VM57_10350 [Stenotrophomonas maltophilia]
MPLEFNAPAGDNLFDKAKVVGKSTPRIDGPRKTTGTAPYAYERHDVAPNQVYGYIVGAGIGKGRIIRWMPPAHVPPPACWRSSPHRNQAGRQVELEQRATVGGSEVAHYHQAIACVVAETFEQARAAAALIRTRYERGKGRFDSQRWRRPRRWPRGAVASPTGRRSAIRHRLRERGGQARRDLPHSRRNRGARR